MEINWTPIAEAIDAHLGDNSLERGLVRRMVASSLARWWDDDLKHFRPLEIEQERLAEVPGSPVKFKYVVDMLVEVLAVPPYLSKKRVQPGDLLMLDYKTTGLDLNSSYGRGVFDESYAQSKQPKYYLTAYPDWVAGLLFRGTSTQPIYDNTYSHYHLYVAQPEQPYDLARDLCITAAQLEAIKNFPVWTKNDPKACKAYGYPCPHLSECRADTPTPQFVMPPHLSFSSIQQFSACPERFRRDKLVVGERLQSTTALRGTAYHAGMAAAYAQHPLYAPNSKS